MRSYKDIFDCFLPFGTRRRKWCDLGLKGIQILVNEGGKSLFRQYKNYMNNQRATRIYWNNNRLKSGVSPSAGEYKKLAYCPKFSIIIPTWNTEERWLAKTLNSVLNQYYNNYEICIADGGSTNEGTRKIIDSFANKDSRIKLLYLPNNEGISGNSNRALSFATGEFVGFLDHDDELTPDALYENAMLINEHPEADLIYSDHAKIDESGNIYDEEFKPDWSPELLLSYCYIGHFKVVRKSILDEAGWFQKEYDGSQDYDLILRISERTDKIFHIPKILYLWRATRQSVAKTASCKPLSLEAGRMALKKAILRRGISGNVVIPESAARNGIGIYKIEYLLKNLEKVTIIIPTRDNAETLKKCIRSIESLTTYENYEILLIDNGSRNRDALEYIETLKESKHKVLSFPTDDFNFSKIINYGVSKSESEVIILLNDDTEVITRDWIQEMLGWLQSDEKIGAVGCKLIYKDKRIQHAGVVLGICGNPADHAFKLNYYNNNGYLNYINVVRNYSAVTAACLMTRKSIFYMAGKFDENRLPISFNDVDFCLKLVAKGYRIVYTPHALLFHYEGSTRGTGAGIDNQNEVDFFKSKYKKNIYDDIYYNKNLSLADHNFSFKHKDKILFISHNLNQEGAPLFLYTLAKELKLRGFPVLVASVLDGPLKFDLEEHGIEVVLCDPGNINRIINEYSPKMIVINTIENYRFLDKIKDQQCHIMWIIHESERSHYFNHLKNLSKKHFEIPSAVVFVSNSTKEAYIDLNTKDNFKTIYNGLDIKYIDEFIASNDRAKLRNNLGIPEDFTVIITVGTVCERKDQETFIRAASEIIRKNKTTEKLMFLLIGARKEIPYFNKISHLISSLHLEDDVKIVFSAEIPRRIDVLKYYLISDIYICTSQIEAFPITILEAMAFSLPIISTDVFGIKEQITNDREGLIFIVKDYQDLRTKIELLINDETYRRTLGKNARIKLNENFTLEDMTYHYEDLINVLISKHSD